MHFLLSLLIGGIILVLLTRALIETVIGLCQVTIGLVLLAFSYALDAFVWSIHALRSLWRTACG